MYQSVDTSEALALRIDKSIKFNEQLFRIVRVALYVASLVLAAVISYTVSLV